MSGAGNRKQNESATASASSMVAEAASAARRWRGLLHRRETVSQIVRNMIARANGARDTGDYRDAADLSPTSGLADMVSRLVPELAPRKPHELRHTFVASIHIRRLGARRERSSWGVLPTLRGVQAIRGFCLSSDPIVDFQIAIDRQIVYKGLLQGHAIEGGPQDQLKYV